MADEKKPEKNAKPADKPKPTRREAMYGKKKPEAKTAPNDDTGKAKSAESAEGEGEAVNPLVDAHAAMVKRQEVERRDLHASHRNDHRLMATRHEAEMSEMMGAAPVGVEGAAAPAETE